MARTLDDLSAPVPAHVDEAGKLSYLVAHDDDRDPADLGGDVVTRPLQRPDVADVLPAAFEDLLALALEDVLADVPVGRQGPARLDRRTQLVSPRHESPHISTPLHACLRNILA